MFIFACNTKLIIMKKLLFVLLFIPLVCFGQDDINIELKTQSLGSGDSAVLAFSIKYLNNGKYEHSKKAPTDLWSTKRTIRKTMEDMHNTTSIKHDLNSDKSAQTNHNNNISLSTSDISMGRDSPRHAADRRVPWGTRHAACDRSPLAAFETLSRSNLQTSGLRLSGNK